MAIAALSARLRQDPQGIWAGPVSGPLSYPPGGHGECLQLEDRSFWFGHRNACILAALERHPPPGPILDIGGGNGYVTRRLLDEGFDAALLEPGPEGARNARFRRGIPEVIRSTLVEAGLPPGCLGGAGCFDVIEHVEDPRALVAEIHRLLVPGGILYATFPAHDWLWSGSDVRAGHYRRYDRAKVGSLLEGGFDILLFTHFFTALVPPLLLFRTLPFRLGFRRGLLGAASEHGGGGPAGRLLAGLLAKEPERIRAGETARLGTSCLCIARKRAPGPAGASGMPEPAP